MLFFGLGEKRLAGEAKVWRGEELGEARSLLRSMRGLARVELAPSEYFQGIPSPPRKAVIGSARAGGMNLRPISIACGNMSEMAP